MNKSIIIVSLILLFGIFGYFFLNQQTNKNTPSQKENTSKQNLDITPQSQVVEKQASFTIFTNGTFRIFTASMYHNLSEDVYIEASNPNIVKVKKAGITWNNFFSTLPFKLTHDCLTTGTKETFCTGSDGALKFYLNGESSKNALDQEINNGDKLLVTFGEESEDEIKQQLNKIP